MHQVPLQRPHQKMVSLSTPHVRKIWKIWTSRERMSCSRRSGTVLEMREAEPQAGGLPATDQRMQHLQGERPHGSDEQCNSGQMLFHRRHSRCRGSGNPLVLPALLHLLPAEGEEMQRMQAEAARRTGGRSEDGKAESEASQLLGSMDAGPGGDGHVRGRQTVVREKARHRASHREPQDGRRTRSDDQATGRRSKKH